MGWRKRRRNDIWSGKHGRNVLMIEVVTWAQQVGKSPIVSDLKLEFFLFRFSTNILAEIRYKLWYGRNDWLNRPTVRPVFPVEPWFVRFSQNSSISNFLCLKNRISVRFPVFPVRPSDPVRISNPWLQHISCYRIPYKCTLCIVVPHIYIYIYIYSLFYNIFTNCWCGFNIFQIVVVSKNVMLVMSPY